ncbi:hypothetical protein [Treponema sp. R80B11-R83G3]
MKTREAMRAVVEILLDITKDKVEYDRLCDELVNHLDYQNDRKNIKLSMLKEAREENHNYLLGLLNPGLTTDEIKQRFQMEAN